MFLPTYADLSKITVSFSGADSIAFLDSGFSDEQKITFYDGWKQTKRLEKDVVYEVQFYNYRKILLAQGRVKLLQSDNLPAAFIDTESGSLAYINEDKSHKEAGKMTLYDVEGYMEYNDSLKHMTGRGNQTWDFDKRSYGIKLSEAADLLQMGKSRSWILLSNVYDDAYIRNKITYDMALAAGMEGSAESRFIDLYVNGQYHGMYQLCEKVEIGRNRIDIADLDEQNKRSNRIDTENMVSFNKAGGAASAGAGGGWEKGIVLETEPQDISGGYLIERDYGEKYEKEISGFRTDLLQDCYVLKNPELASEGEVSYIGTLFREMEEAVCSGDGTNSSTGKTYLDYIDLDSFARKYIVEEFSRNDGGGSTSSFFYKPEDEISRKIFAGPVWDYDKAYGRVKNYDENTQDLGYMTLHHRGTELFWYLYRQPEFQDRVRKLYQEEFLPFVKELTDEKIDSYVEEIRASAFLDRIRWEKTYDLRGEQSDDFREVASYIKNFCLDRRQFLDQVWIDESPVCTVYFIDEKNQRYTHLGVIRGSAFESIPDATVEGLTFKGWFYEDSLEQFDKKVPVLEDAVVIAQWE